MKEYERAIRNEIRVHSTCTTCLAAFQVTGPSIRCIFENESEIPCKLGEGIVIL